jgi:hypothetical protein
MGLLSGARMESKHQVSTGDKYVGKRVVLGLTVAKNNGEVEQRQIVGLVSQCSPGTGTVITSESDAAEKVRLPYYPDAFIDAPRGNYHLSSTGVEVRNPDFMMSWTFQQDEGGRWHAKPDPIEPPPARS